MGTAVNRLAGILAQPTQPSPATGIWRTASPFNRIATNLTHYTAVATRVAFRTKHVIGSGNCSNLRLVLQNWWATSAGALNLLTPFNSATYSNLYLESQNLATSVAVTVAGSGSAVMAAGDYDLNSDTIAASAFSLTKFTVGEVYYIRGFLDIPLNGWAIKQDFVDDPLSVASSYDTAVTTCSNISGTGVLTFTGTAPAAAGPVPVLLIGQFISGDPRTWLAVGDSIAEGFNGSQTNGYGWIGRALYNGNTSPLAGINSGITGSTINMWTASSGSANPARLNSYVKYCNSGIYNYGTNSFGTGAAPNDSTALNAVIAGDRALWLQIRAAIAAGNGLRPFKLIGCYLMPRTTGTYATPGAQTIFGPQWDINGDVDALNISRASDVGVANRLDYLFNGGSVVRFDSSSNTLTDYHKWAASATGDGLHPNPTPISSLGTLLRTLLDTV